MGANPKVKDISGHLHMLDAIHQSLLASKETGRVGLYSGDAGILLFFWCWLKHQPHTHPQYAATEQRFQQGINALLQQVATVPRIEFGNGSAGICWLMEMLLQEQSAPYQANFNQQFELLQVQNLQALHTWPGELELIRGLAGQLVAATRRLLANPDSAPTIEWIRHLLRLLQQSAEFEEALCYWPTPQSSVFFQQQAGANQVNLGLAHGMPGILAALVPLVRIAALRDVAEPLLRGGCEWLLRQQLPADRLSVFSTCYPQTHDSRVGWCYGDLTIALTLSRAAAALDVRHWREAALAISLKASQRTASDGHIADCGVCHGSIGLVLIFRLLAEQLAELKLHAVAQQWLDWTSQRFTAQGVTALFPQHQQQSQHGFLEGLAGIGLVLLRESGQFSSWADALLLANPAISSSFSERSEQNEVRV